MTSTSAHITRERDLADPSELIVALDCLSQVMKDENSPTARDICRRAILYIVHPRTIAAPDLLAALKATVGSLIANAEYGDLMSDECAAALKNAIAAIAKAEGRT